LNFLGRAGRDGKKSFCRLYYDKDEVNCISFLLKQDLNKNADKKSEKYKRAEQAIKEFERIVHHCESVSCRHLLFTNHFGDPAPRCDAMCDACKDKKKCTAKLEKFQQLSMKLNLGSVAMDDGDPSDLYEGKTLFILKFLKLYYINTI
jgi:ATP-dependent DNA helicase Q5